MADGPLLRERGVKMYRPILQRAESSQQAAGNREQKEERSACANGARDTSARFNEKQGMKYKKWAQK
jgi:hypothetical protein